MLYTFTNKRSVMKLLLILLLGIALQAKHTHKESYYQNIFCDKMGGKAEVVLKDRTRIDCLTDKYAIEVDFANKWAESIGQSLHYGLMTKRQSGVYLIIEDEKDFRYLDRLNRVVDKYDIKVWTK